MTRSWWLRVLGVNGVFLAFHPWLGLPWPRFVSSLAVNAALFVLPAIGWSTVLGSGTRAVGGRVMRALLISTVVFFTAIMALWIAGATPTQVLGWNAIWLLTNLGFARSAWAGSTQAVRRALSPREALMAAVLFCGSYTVYWGAAVFIVPLQVDQDLEVQATGYGLLTRFEPLLLTDRGTVHFFAHPPLLHFYVAGSFLLYGSFPDLEFFDAASRRALAARAGANGSGGPENYEAVDKVELDAIYRRYGERPHKLESRTPNLLFASVTVALLGIWAGRIARQSWVGPLVAVSYASSPEVVVRSSYGGYFAIGGLVIILMLLAVEARRRWPTIQQMALGVAAGACAGLSDHKLILLPATLVLYGIGSPRLERSVDALDRPRVWRARSLLHPVVIGFGLGLAAFWAFGLTWAPATFLKDHLHDHLLDRITHQNPLGYRGYPLPLNLWSEFLQHTGFLILPIGLVVLTWDALRRPSAPEGRHEPLRALWLIWVLVTAVAFTIVDWRMTKHLVPILLAVNLALVPNPDAPAWRSRLAAGTWTFTILLNVVALVSLVRDFAGYVVLPGW